MINFGKVKPGDTLCIPFSSFASSTGASITLTGLAVTDIAIYKDGGVVQRASTSGFTLLDTDGIDFDLITGIHGFSISLADNTTAGFYAAGSDYFVVVSTVTVDSQTVSFLAAKFTIGYVGSVLDTTIATLASQTSFTLTAGPAEDNALNGMWLMAHDVASAVQSAVGIVSAYTGATKTVTLVAAPTFAMAATDNISVMGPMPLQPTVTGRTVDISATGEAGVDWANIGSPTTAQTLSGTTVGTATAVGSVTGAVGSVTGNVGGNVVGSVGSVTGAVGSVTGAVGSVTGNVGGNVVGSVASVTAGVTLAASAVQAIWDALTTALTTAGSIGKRIADNLDAAISSRSTVTTAQVRTEIDAELGTDTLAELSQAIPAATPTMKTAIMLLYMSLRNKLTQTATVMSIHNDAGTVVCKSATSDDATTFTRDKLASGP